MDNKFDIAGTYYGSRENLLELITRKLEYYRPLLHVFTFLQPDEPHPAHFTDEIARHCLATYDPDEPLDHALERSIVRVLHHYSAP